jgi:hypothetical protein
MTTTTNATLPDNTKAALALLGTYTGGRFDPAMLTGPAKRSCRKHILEALRGDKVKSAECGITVVEAALIEAAGATGDCQAARRDSLREIARAAS